MNFLTVILAVSFLPFFEARNQVANFVVTPPPEGTSVKPELPDLVVREKCPACEGKGELVLEDPLYCSEVSFTVGSWIDVLDHYKPE